MIVIIPAYKPDEKLIRLVDELQNKIEGEILIVDDGGGEQYRPIFEEVKKKGCRVLTHTLNRGKGAALKTAFSDIEKRVQAGEIPSDEPVCCADADGQHKPADILRCLEETKAHPDSFILGSRAFRGDVPARSRIGNSISRFTFRLLMGVKVFDTQTGLRAFRAKNCAIFKNVKGDRYEFEMQQLCDACKNKIPIREVEIETVYIEDNASSHFNPLKDAMRVYGVLIQNATGKLFCFLEFLLSSGLAWIIDFLLYTLFSSFLVPVIDPLVSLPLSILMARICSSLVNFLVNRKIVFHSKEKGFGTLVRYALLVVVVYCGNSALTVLFNDLGVGKNIAFILSQIICFPISFFGQHYVVFPKKKQK